jgi:soluble lytic murein transglycosylase-like protein
MTTRTDFQTDGMRPPARLFMRGGLLLGAAVLVSALAGWPRRAGADDSAPSPSAEFVSREIQDLTGRLQMAQGEAALLRIQLERAEAVHGYSTQYQIPADLAASIYDIALSEGIEPALAFRLVKVESNFKQTARSNMAAIGYTQLRLATARYYQPGITEAELANRDVNLRIGFRFLKDLLERFDNNLNHALLAYNRGPTIVAGILAQGGDPANGYTTKVLRGDPRASQLPATLN